MKSNNLSFPHPVLGLNEDIEGICEITNFNIFQNDNEYTIQINYNIDNADLLHLIKAKKVAFMCEIVNTPTYLRKQKNTFNKNISFSLNRKDVKGKVEIICTLIAIDNIYHYKNSKANNDYDNFDFTIKKGDVLAFFGSCNFNASIKYDKLTGVSAFMYIENGKEISNQTRYSLDGDAIIIKLPEELYMQYTQDIINIDLFTNILLSSLVLNALICALHHLKKYQTLWADTIRYLLRNDKRFKKIDCRVLLDDEDQEDDIQEDSQQIVLEVAQIFLDNPYNRLFRNLEKIKEVISSKNE